MITIHNMQASDLDFAAGCTAAEGWASETGQVFEDFYAHHPGGCFIARQAGQPIGIGIATPYGEYGFIGELIVSPQARGRGVGRMLLDQLIGYLRQCGAQTILLDGVVRAVPLYERAGFSKICRSLRFVGAIRGRTAAGVRPMQEADLEQVFRLDRQAFGADRSFFLRRRLKRFPDMSRVLEQEGRITGFLLGRQGETPDGPWFAAGPWIVLPGVEHPEALLESLAPPGDALMLSLGILETNTEALRLVQSLNFKERLDSPWRMGLGRPGNLGASPAAFAVGSAAKG
jgi:ribosomal protein S18 acetylase RimI-like enzyme